MACLSRPTVPGFDIRWARHEDAIEIARLFLISSEGLAAYIWGTQADAGQSLEEIGARRYARQAVAFSYQNCLLATRGQEILGMIHAFPMLERASGDVETDPVLRPYAELEDPGSFYVSGLAVYPPYRRRGIGEALLQGADALAARRGLPRLSLICFDRNTIALDWYARHGFRVVDRRQIVPHPALHRRDGDALLMVRPAGGPGELMPSFTVPWSPST